MIRILLINTSGSSDHYILILLIIELDPVRRS